MRRDEDGPLLQVALPDSPEAKGADGKDGSEDDCASGPLGGEVAAVLDRGESLCWGQVSDEGGRSARTGRGRARARGDGGEGYVLLDRDNHG